MVNGSVLPEHLVASAAELAPGRQCFSLVADEALLYDYTAAAELFSQINGGLAALVFAAIIFLIERHTADERLQPRRAFQLLPVIFVAAVLTAYQYGVVAADRLCERVAIMAILAGTGFVFVVLAVMATTATLLAYGGRELTSAASVASAGFVVASVAGCLNLALALSDAREEFGLAELSGVGLTSAAVVPLVIATGIAIGGERFRTRLPPTSRIRKAVRFDLAVLGVSSAALLGSIVLFSLASSNGTWDRAIGVQWMSWLNYAVPASVAIFTGALGAGILADRRRIEDLMASSQSAATLDDTAGIDTQ